MALLTATLLLGAVVATAAQDVCYASNNDPYLHFAAKTAYEFAYDRRKPEDILSCQPAQVWVLMRHGTRYPKRAEMQNLMDIAPLRDQILRNSEQREGRHLCWEDLNNLRNWNLTATLDQESLLTAQGRDDMKYMALRFKTRYPGLLERPYNVGMYKLRYTDRELTKQSAEVFSRAMFGLSTVHFMEPPGNDTLLRPYRNCETWRKQVEENQDTYKEVRLFEEGPEMQSLIQNVSTRLGFRYKLNIHQIDMMYDMCRYDKAWQVRQVSPWCAAFSTNELKVLEYREDMFYYYYSSYGNHLNLKLGCPAIRDMLQHFTRVEESSGDTGPLGVFYFSHLPTLHMALTQLGIARDSEPLKHSNYMAMKRRKWQTSQLGAFASNLVAVLYRCTDGEPYRVMFYVSEKLVPYDGCNVGLCSWQYIKNKLAHIAAGCDLGFCNPGSNSGTTVSMLSCFAVGGLVLAHRFM